MKEEYTEYKNLLEEYLLDYLPEIDTHANVLKEAVHYSLLGGGKRLRPVLLMAACEFAGGSFNAAMPYACAIEYIHTYSLIHDDLPAMDDDDMRRGRPSNHKVFGDGIATLAGDALLNSAFEIMSKNMLIYMDDIGELNKRVQAMYCITKAAGVRGMIAGQAADLSAELKSPEEHDEGLLHFIHENKTAALIVAAIKAGLYLGNADDEMMSDLTRYAENLGIAFQISDDILDVTGETEETGKDKGSDEANGKLTFVSKYGIDKAKEELRKYIDAAVKATEPYYDNAEFFRNIALELYDRKK